MNLIPNTVCRRCHREYPSFRGRCPYCGTKKSREVKRSLPESDSAVRGTEAARQAAENINWQMLIGGILLVCILAVVISIVSVNVRSHVDETVTLGGGAAAGGAAADVAAETTAVPIPTATPTPTPEPTPQITSISITFMGNPMEGFMEGVGTQIDLDATPYPLTEGAVVEWSSTDENVATVDQDGVVTVTGSSGYCDIVASVGTVQATCRVWGK